jgi:hypothetical protein
MVKVGNKRAESGLDIVATALPSEQWAKNRQTRLIAGRCLAIIDKGPDREKAGLLRLPPLVGADGKRKQKQTEQQVSAHDRSHTITLTK